MWLSRRSPQHRRAQRPLSQRMDLRPARRLGLRTRRRQRRTRELTAAPAAAPPLLAVALRAPAAARLSVELGVLRRA
eukprot:3098749-Alexandrium_andersonii.AAC.1